MTTMRSRNRAGESKTQEPLKITFECDNESSSEVSNTNEFYSLDQHMIDRVKKTPYRSFQVNTIESDSFERSATGKLCKPRPMLNMKAIPSREQSDKHMKGNNVFGYTPYDTGRKESDFTTMYGAVNKQKSILACIAKFQKEEKKDIAELSKNVSISDL